MSTKLIILIMLAFAISHSQNLVSISGTVKNSRTNDPVAGANVKLLTLKLSTTTDTNGNFKISGTSIRQISGIGKKNVPFVESKTIFFRNEQDGPALIRIFDLSGKLQSTVFSGTLKSGLWQFIPPRLLPGIHFYVFDTPQSRYSIRFLNPVSGSNLSKGSLKKVQNSSEKTFASVAALPVDSLIVEKSDYISAHIPVENYNQTGINITLQETSSNLENTTIVPDPSWTCFMPDGIPPPKLGTAVFNITLQYSAVHNVGITKFGQRYQYDIKGGTMTGDRIDGTVLSGGLDYELILSTGSIELEQIIILRAKDNTPILMRNAGVAPAGEKNVRMVLDFEAPNSSSHTWLNTGKFAATRIVDSVAKTIKLEVYDISKVSLPQTHVQIKDPANVVNQTWDCVKISGTQGATVFTENVSLGSSISIGASKRGSRNIIPITGGTTTGKVTGKILSGGADYQLNGLDARYTLAPNDGEFIIVRNCGSNGLIPVFEARVGGPYEFLNENKYLSSQPGMSGGGVSITFYEKK